MSKIFLLTLFLISFNNIVSVRSLFRKEIPLNFDNYNNESYIEEILNTSKYINDKTKLEKISKIRKLLSNQDLNEQNNVSSNDAFPSFIFLLFDAIASLIHDYDLTYLFEEPDFETCVFDGILDNLLDNKLIETYIDGSGKGANDFGNEFICNYNVKKKVAYMTIHFYLGTPDFKRSGEDFFGQGYFYMGFCLPRKCSRAAKLLIKNKDILKICYDVGISNFKLYINEEVVEESNKLSKFYEITIIIYLILNALKLLIGILRIIFMNKGYEGYYAELERKKGESKTLPLGINDSNINEKTNQSIPNNSSKLLDFNSSYDNNSQITNKENSSFIKNIDHNDSDATSVYDNEISENIISEGENLFNPFSDKEKNFPTSIKLMKMFDLFDNIKLLSTSSNKLYNSNKIKILYFIRFLLMIMSIIHQIMITQIKLPTKNYYNFEFYSRFGFIFIKLCINASTFWITLDGVIFAYKLMSYIKKEIKLSRNKQVKYLAFLKFLLLILPKFFVFLFAFILLHLKASKLTFELCKGNNVFANYLYYNDTVQQESYSLRTTHEFKDFFKNFIPFKLNYIDFIENITIQKKDVADENISNFTTDVSGYEIPSPFLTNTDLFVNVCFNEFYLIILMINITFLSYKLKNKIFDFAILIINIVLYILPAIYQLNPNKINWENQIYNLKFVLGQNYSEKFTHYFINFFYFGFLIGVMKFYHDENIYNIKKKKNILKDITLPFEFCKKIIIYLNGFRHLIKGIILWFSIAVLLLISSSFTLSEGNKFSYDDSKILEIKQKIEFKAFYKFLFFYEKNLSGIFFFIFLIMYIIYPKNSYLIKLASSNAFIILERISFAFYNCFCYLIYAQFCVFIISIQMSYSNLFFNSVGMFFIIFVFSLLNVALFELPIRQLIKYIMNRKLENNFFENYYKSYSSRTASFSSDEISSKLE